MYTETIPLPGEVLDATATAFSLHPCFPLWQRAWAHKSFWEMLCRELQCLSQQKDQEDYVQHLIGSASSQ